MFQLEIITNKKVIANLSFEKLDLIWNEYKVDLLFISYKFVKGFLVVNFFITNCYFRWKMEIYFIEWALDGIFSRVACHAWKYYRLMLTKHNNCSIYLMLLQRFLRYFLLLSKWISPSRASNLRRATSMPETVIFWRHKFDVVASEPMTRHFPLNS